MLCFENAAVERPRDAVDESEPPEHSEIPDPNEPKACGMDTEAGTLTASVPLVENDNAGLVERSQNLCDGADEELYHFLVRSIGKFLTRRLGPHDGEDALHDIFLIVITAVRSRRLNDPRCLTAYIHTVARRTIMAAMKERAQTVAGWEFSIIPSKGNQELDLVWKERGAMATRIFQALPAREREILTRFYLEEQTKEEICAAMHLSPDQFRLLKSKAKLRLEERARRCLNGAGESVAHA